MEIRNKGIIRQFLFNREYVYQSQIPDKGIILWTKLYLDGDVVFKYYTQNKTIQSNLEVSFIQNHFRHLRFELLKMRMLLRSMNGFLALAVTWFIYFKMVHLKSFNDALATIVIPLLVVLLRRFFIRFILIVIIQFGKLKIIRFLLNNLLFKVLSRNQPIKQTNST